MNDLEKEVKESSAFKLACEANRLLSLAEEDDLRLVKLSDAKKLVYVEEELKIRASKLLPGLLTITPSLTKEEREEEEMGSNPNYINEILGSYYERKSKAKVVEQQLRFFVKVINKSLNTTIASVPVMAGNKDEAIEVARKKCAQKFGNKNLEFKVS